MGMRTNRVQPDLASLRRKQGLSLGEIAQKTKIGSRYLEAIERGHFAKLPGGFYDVSYIRQYAQAVGCDEHSLLEEYRSSLPDPRDAAIAGAPVQAASKSSSSRLGRWLDLKILLNVSMRMLRRI